MANDYEKTECEVLQVAAKAGAQKAVSNQDTQPVGCQDGNVTQVRLDSSWNSQGDFSVPFPEKSPHFQKKVQAK